MLNYAVLVRTCVNFRHENVLKNIKKKKILPKKIATLLGIAWVHLMR